MAQLSAQSIYKLCMEGCGNPMILPFIDHKEVVNGMSFGLSAASYDVRIAHPLRMPPRTTALAHTIEDFCMPANVVGYVIDKSSWARRFVSAMNTLIDPGFHGNLTLELVNLSEAYVTIEAGDPICQIAFHWLDQPTDRAYSGKYQHQTKAAHGVRFEKAIGSER